MPNQSPNSARTAASTVKVRDPRLLASPHSVPSFWRLFGLYQSQTRPITADAAYGDDEGTGSFEYMGRNLSLGADRIKRYDIFDEMDTFGLVSSVLNVYAEESTQPDYDKGQRVWIESKANHMIDAGESCLRNCQVEDRIWAITRRMCKYGDAFQRLLYSAGKGVLGWRYARQHDIERVEDKFGRLVGFKEYGFKYRKSLHADGADTSFPWDYIHFRLLGKHEEDGYGTGIPEGFFREWRYMTLTEDSILMYRLRRAPDRNMVMVDVGSLEDHEAMRYVNQWRKRLRKYELVDPSSSDYKKQYNPLTPLEDIFIPIRQDTNTRIETLSGAGNVGEVYDLDHFRDSFFGAAAAPKAYFGFEGEINAKATLQQQDVRFARGCKRIQRAAVFGLRQLLDVHYTLLATDDATTKKFNFGDKANAYLVQMSPISYLDEFERLELVQMRMNLVTSQAALPDQMKMDPRVWCAYLLLNYAKLPEDVVLRLIQQTPEKPATGSGPAFDALPEDMKKMVLDNGGNMRRGFTQITEAEAKQIAKCVHTSPMLRRNLANFAELALEGDDAILRASMYQTDPSILPVFLPAGQTLNDSYSDNLKIRELMEDLAILKNPERMKERQESIMSRLDERTRSQVDMAAGALGTARKQRTLNG